MVTDADRAHARFEVGDAVRFATRGGSGRTGTVEKLNPKRARVRCDEGTWAVPYPLLEHVDGAPGDRTSEERLVEVARQARALMDEHGLDGWAFRFSAAESRLGECREREKEIRLSRRHAVKGGPREVRDTILHEIAHAHRRRRRPGTDPRGRRSRSGWGRRRRPARRRARTPARTGRRRRRGSGRAWR